MKKSEITVSMPMTTFEELESYKNMFYELKCKIRDCIRPSTEEGIDYLFYVDRTLKLVKEVSNIEESSNVEKVYG